MRTLIGSGDTVDHPIFAQEPQQLDGSRQWPGMRQEFVEKLTVALVQRLQFRE